MKQPEKNSGFRPGNTARQKTVTATGKLPPNLAMPRKRRDAAANTMVLVIGSLLCSLIGLGVIFGFQIEMQGTGAYLYLLVSVSAIIYIASTVVYVVLSVRKRPQGPGTR